MAEVLVGIALQASGFAPTDDLLEKLLELRDTQENKVPVAIFPIGALLRVGGASP